jgi:hypothetical protein
MQQFFTPGFYVELIMNTKEWHGVYGLLRNHHQKKTIKHAPAAD